MTVRLRVNLRLLAFACVAATAVAASAVAPSPGAASSVGVQGATTAQNGVSASLSIPVPAATQAGDVLLAIVDIQYQPTITPPAGWSLVRQDVSSAGNHLVQAVYVHAAGAGEPASYSWSFSAAHAAVGAMVDCAGLDPTNPVQASAAAFASNQSVVTAPSVTTAAPGEILLTAFATSPDRAVTLPGAVTSEYAIGSHPAAGEKVGAAGGDRAVATAGATGSTSASLDASANGIGTSLALNLAGSGSGGGGQDQPPVVDSISLTPTSPRPTDLVTAAVTAHDPDGDPIAFVYRWTISGVVVQTTQTASTSDTLDLSSACSCTGGEKVTVQVTPSDGTLSGTPAGAAVTVAGGGGSSFGSVQSFATPGQALPANLTSGPDGNIWFTEESVATIGRATVPGGAITAFPIPSQSTAFNGIVTGPDGNLWFVDGGAAKIGRLDPSTRAIVEFPMLTANAGGGSIAVGSDGNLWFCESKASKIGRITTAGKVTEFRTKTSSAFPHGITAGPDGNLWFTELNANKIGRITPAGVVTEFSVPTASSGPAVITRGPDGNLWFAEQKASKIGRITTAGRITQFTTPTTGAWPVGIVSGPDGNLWFAENHANQIARITPAGVVSEFPIGSGIGPDKVAIGSDGNLWFTEHTAGAIGVFSLH